jgi:2-hydroxyglutarate dehydrogenase
MDAAQPRCDVAVIGAGILGLALAREVSRREPRASICVLERESRPAAHQTGHNSGVIHAGIYYAPGSLKARLSVQGAAEMYRYCEQSGIPHRRSGKLIVALEPRELAPLAELERRARANGVEGLRRVDADELRAIEPSASGIAALHSPGTGIVDYREVAGALARELRDGGARIDLDCEVRSAMPAAGGLRITHSQGTTLARRAIFCAGAWADTTARAAYAQRAPRILPFRGAYMRVAPAHRGLVRSLIYPVPNPALPFLGVHLTRTIHGELLIGPSALPAFVRSASGRVRDRAADLFEALRWPGTWLMLARSWRTGLAELANALLPGRLLGQAARYVPALAGAQLEPGFAGVRAQAVARDGRLIDDFVFSFSERAVHVRSAPSPGATAAFAIARHVAQEAERALGPTWCG